jgi:homoserine dehydrogenase
VTDLRVAVLGAGTVGREVVRAFLETPDRLVVPERVEVPEGRLSLAGVAVRDIERAAASGVPRELLSDDPRGLAASDRVDVVCELLGGEEPARSLIAETLASGRPVVTANKHVVAHHGPALEAAAGRSGASLRFEAAVAGGVPVLATLAGGLAANRVRRIRSIVNGTTNVILSAMVGDGRSYDEALAEARAAGYAEADPSADVEGLDAANKLAILARVALGVWLDPDAIERRPPTVDGRGAPGILGVGAREVAAAASLGLVVKLVADLVGDADGSVHASVLPTAVPAADPLARTNGRINRVEVRAEPLGSMALVGPGAGGGPTASAVLGDLLAIAREERSTWHGRRLAERDLRQPSGPITSGPERGWFTVLPAGARPGSLGDRIAAAIECAPIDRGTVGTAVHVRGGSLEEVRAALRSAGGRGDDVVFPADEHVA